MMSKHPCVSTLDKSNKNLINIINTTKSNKPFGVLFDNGIKEVHPVLIPGSISLNRYMSPIAVTYKMEEGETVSNNKACFSVKFLHLLFNKYNIVDSDLSAIKEYSDFCVLNGKSVPLNTFFKKREFILGFVLKNKIAIIKIVLLLLWLSLFYYNYITLSRIFNF